MKTLYYQGFEETNFLPQRPALGPPLPALLNIFWPGVKPPERASPVKFWDTDGSYQLKENKLVPDVKYSGTYSLKFSVTLDSGGYCYFEEMLPTPILLEKYRDTRLEGYLLPLDLNGVRFNIGYNVMFPNAPGRSGSHIIGPPLIEGKEWVKVSSVSPYFPYEYMKASAEERGLDWRGFYLDRWYLSFAGRFSGQTVTVFVDNVKIFTP